MKAIKIFSLLILSVHFSSAQFMLWKVDRSGCKAVLMKLIITILILISTARAQDTLPMRIWFKTSTGVIKTIYGFGVLKSDTAMNRIHNIPERDSLPHFVFPAAFLNSRKRPVTGIIINFDYLFKTK